MKKITLREAAPISSPNIAHSSRMHGTLRNVIFTSLIGQEIDVSDTLRFNNNADFLYRLATALRMPPNREYWRSTKEPQVTDLHWQLGFQWHRRGIELVFKSLDCFTKRLFHTATFFCCYICICCLKLHQADYKVEILFCFVFLTSIWWGSTQLQCVYYLRRILISRPPRVFRRFKRRSCLIWYI